MPIKTNLKSFTPRKEAFKREIQLISGGYTNRKAFPDGKILVYPWDNEVNEWMLENARRLTKEELMYGLLAQCCNLNGAKSDDFIAEEITLILLVSRARLSDDRLTYKSVCPYCYKTVDETVFILGELQPVGQKTADYPGFDVVTLLDIQDVIKLRPIQVADERGISNRKAQEKAQIGDNLLRTLMRIVSINDSQPDRLDELNTWFQALSPKDAKFIEDQGRLLTPHLNTTIPHVCEDPDCNREFFHTLTFDQEFFR